MVMKSFRLNRRTVIRGAGSIAIGLPWLECMTSDKEAKAAPPATAQRFIAVYYPGGVVRRGAQGDRYTPTGTETAPVLSQILAPLEPVKSKINIIDGLNMNSAVGEQHQAGIIALLTGTEQGTAAQPAPAAVPAGAWAKGPSIDQVIATRFLTGKPIKSLELAIRWATGKSKGRLHPINSLNFEDNTSFSPIPPRIDPQRIYDEIFGGIGGGMTPTNVEAIRILRKKSILSHVDRKYVALSQRLGAADRVRLDEHLQKIRDIEMGLVPPEPPTASCMPPTRVDTMDYNPTSGLNSSDSGSVRDTQTDAAIPKVGRFMMDMMVMAMACDRTAVGTIQWSDTEAKHTFPWLNLMDHHHYYQHDGGFRAAECATIAAWYSEMHLYLLQKMQATIVGPNMRTLLDDSVVLFGSELQYPEFHEKNNMPMLLAGNGGGMRTGRWIRASTQSHNNLLVSVLRLFGYTSNSFGTARHTGSALTGATLT
jgi:hypothetical protein